MFWMILTGTGCTDYNLYEKETEVAADPFPILRYEPESIDLGQICAQEIIEIILINDGDAPLLIEDAEVVGDDWQLIENLTPLEIAIGSSHILQLNAGVGDAELFLRSNDPDRELSTIPLHSEIDLAPVLQIEGPGNGSILTEETLLQATVWDERDAPESLLVQWQSNLDGIFSTDSANSLGEMETIWNDSHSPGYHSIQLTVSDSCENTASGVLNICQQMSYEIENFDISTWHFEGVANWDSTNEWVELTSTSQNTVGTAFSTAQTVTGSNISIEFQFFIGGGTGADGISLTALDVDRMTTFLGGTGCGIGYGGDADCTEGPALPGWSLEVDTWYNAGQDTIEADHLMLTFDGDVDGPAILVELPEMEDNGWHHMIVEINEPHVFVAIDGNTFIDQDIQGYYAFPAYVGFTAGTGGSTNMHLIDSLVVTEQLCAY